MSTSNQEFLAKLTEESKVQQKLFIQNIARRLGRSEAAQAATPLHSSKGAPDFWTSYHLNPDENIAKFMSNWQAAGGFTERIFKRSELTDVIARILREQHANSTIRSNVPELEELALNEVLPELTHHVWDGNDPEDSKAAAARADAGIVLADYAVSYTGSVVVASSGDKGRSVSLLPNVLIAIIPVERMYTKLGEVMREVSRIPADEFPAGVHFISGPSRSSDIENDLTIGVHGPGVAFALIVG